MAIFSKDFLQAWTVGLNLVVSICVGLAIGYFLDKYLGTAPWMMVVFFFLGLIAGFRELWKLAKKQQENGSDKDDK